MPIGKGHRFHRQFGASTDLTGRLGARGFSMTEMVMAISIIGVLGAAVIIAMTGVMAGSKEALANDKLEMLNQGLNQYKHSYKEYTYPASDGSNLDEMTVLKDLQYRNPNEIKALTGSPFVRPDYQPSLSTSADDYRIVWTGSRFKLLRPGTPGSGIKVVFDGSDYGTPFVYPPNYSSSGR